MTRPKFRLSLLALAFAAGPMTVPVAVSAQAAQDFQLPPNPAPSATATPTVQGPVDLESGVPAAPRPIATPAPTPQPTATPSPAPSPARSPIAIPTQTARSQPRAQQSEPTVGPPANREAPAAPPSLPGPVSIAETGPEVAAEEVTPRVETRATAGDLSAPRVSSPAPTPAIVMTEDESTPAWWWFADLGLLALLAIAAAWALRRSRAKSTPPQIERPVVRSDGGAASSAPRTTLTLRPEAIRLSRSVMAATLSYRLTVLNRGTEALTSVVIEADLGSASGDRPVEQQVAMAETALEPRHTIPRLAPGQSARFEGKLQLPLSQAGILRQGSTPLLVPLLRLRTTADGIEPQAQTLAIGQQGTGGSSRLLPFRLDEGPRGYEPLAQRALDQPG